MGDIEVIPYVDDHWTHVCELHDRARLIELDGSCDKRAFIPLAQDKNEHNNFKTSEKYVAYLDTELVGFVGTNENIISLLYVELHFQGMGIGRLLLRKALCKIPGSAFLYVLSNNVTALQLYASEGFSVVRKFKSKENGYECCVVHLSQ